MWRLHLPPIPCLPLLPSSPITSHPLRTPHPTQSTTPHANQHSPTTSPWSSRTSLLLVRRDRPDLAGDARRGPESRCAASPSSAPPRKRATGRSRASTSSSTAWRTCSTLAARSRCPGSRRGFEGEGTGEGGAWGEGVGLGVGEPREGGTGNRMVRMHTSLEVDEDWVPGKESTVPTI